MRLTASSLSFNLHNVIHSMKILTSSKALVVPLNYERIQNMYPSHPYLVICFHI